MENKFKIVINVLVSYFCFIWIPMLCVYGHYRLFNSFSAGIVFRRQNLMSRDVRFRRLKTIPVLKGLPISCTTYIESMLVFIVCHFKLKQRKWIHHIELFLLYEIPSKDGSFKVLQFWPNVKSMYLNDCIWYIYELKYMPSEKHNPIVLCISDDIHWFFLII